MINYVPAIAAEISLLAGTIASVFVGDKVLRKIEEAIFPFEPEELTAEEERFWREKFDQSFGRK